MMGEVVKFVVSREIVKFVISQKIVKFVISWEIVKFVISLTNKLKGSYTCSIIIE